NPVDWSVAPVSMSIANNPSGGTLFGTSPQQPSGGFATFADLSIDQPGAGYTLIVSVDSSTATSAAFNIMGQPAQLAFLQQPSNSRLGDIISPVVAVAILD